MLLILQNEVYHMRQKRPIFFFFFDSLGFLLINWLLQNEDNVVVPHMQSYVSPAKCKVIRRFNTQHTQWKSEKKVQISNK